MEREGEWSFKAGKCLIKTSKSLPFCQQEKKKKRKEARWNDFTDDLAATGRKPSCSYKTLHLLLATR